MEYSQLESCCKQSWTQVPLDNGLLVLTLASQKIWNASSEIIKTCNFRNDLHDICSKQKSQKTAYTCTNSCRQWTANRVKLQPALAHWTACSKSPRTSTMVTLVPRASLLGTRLRNNNNHKIHHVRGACWFTKATLRSIAMTPFSSFGRTVSQKLYLIELFIEQSTKLSGFRNSAGRFCISILPEYCSSALTAQA